MTDDYEKWFFGCIMVVAMSIAAGVAATEFAAANSLKREAVALGYATYGPDGFKWKERQ